MDQKLNAFINDGSVAGQSVLYAASPARESLRGQCVQLACLWATRLDLPVYWADAYKWFDLAANDSNWARVVYTGSGIPPAGALVIWSKDLPGGGGAGHIDIATGKGGAGVFVGFDTNWGGKTAHLVTHNFSYVRGWLIPNVPETKAKEDTDSMDDEGAKDIYRALLHREPENDQVWRGFVGRKFHDASVQVRASDEWLGQNHVLKVAYPQTMAQVDQMRTAINEQNQTVTDLRNTLDSTSKSNAEKQATLDAALAKIADLNAQLATSHDQAIEYSKPVSETTATNTPETQSLIARLVALLTRKS